MIPAFIIAAVSADGFIARNPGESSMDWTSAADRQFFRERTKQAGVVVMGSKTFKTIGKALPGRTTIVYSRQPRNYLAGVEVTDQDPQTLLADLERRGFKEVAICGGASIYTAFAKAGCIEKAYITVEPHFFGDGIRLFNEALGISLSLAASKQLAPDVLLLEYSIKHVGTD